MPENKDTVIQFEDQGTIHIAEDVVATIAVLAAAEVDGVIVQPAGGPSVADFIGKKNITRGVKITMEENKVHVDVFMTIKYGFAITAVSQKVQERIKNAIDSMTGLETGNINIHVGGITFEKEKK